MGKGVIELYCWDHSLLRSNVYDSVKDRRKIIDMWWKEYGYNISMCYLLIKPEIIALMDREPTRGRNAKYYRVLKRPNVKKLFLESQKTAG